MTYVIDHINYGDRFEFESLDEAVQSIRERGPEFLITEFSLLPDGCILDESGRVVGHTVDDN